MKKIPTKKDKKWIGIDQICLNSSKSEEKGPKKRKTWTKSDSKMKECGKTEERLKKCIKIVMKK